MNKYKKLALNTMIFAIGSFGSKILVLLLTRLYTKNIDPTGMGIKSQLEMTALFLQPIFTFALQEYLIRFGLDKNYDKRDVFTTSSIITAVGMAAVIIIVPGLRFISPLSFIKGYSLLLAIYVCTSSLRMLCAQFVRARDMVKLFALDGILATLMLLIFNLLFIEWLHMGVKGFMLAVILSDLCSSIFLFAAAKLYKFISPKHFKISLAQEMMRYSLPLIPTIVMWTITSLSDRLFISNMHSSRVQLGLDMSGIYSLAAIVPNLISMVSTIFFQAWNMSAISENESADRSKFYERVYNAYEAVLFIASAGLLLFIKPVTAFLNNTSNFEEYSTVYIYAPILVASVIFMSLNQFLGGIYTATKHTQNSLWTSAFACAANLILNYFLIPAWGIQGAAVATFLSYFMCFLIRLVDARFYVPFKVNFAKSFVNTAVIIIMCVIIIKSPKLWGLWLVPFCIAIIAYNFKALQATIQKILKKRSTKATN